MLRIRIATLALASVFALATPLHATWSIILVNPKTGEVAVGGATCIQLMGLKKLLAAVKVGVGAGVTQALLDAGQNKFLIWNELGKGTDPAQILALIAAQDVGFQVRQIGIVDMKGGKITFTGSQTNAWAGGVTGVTGDIHYAIQGNILTGAPVVAFAQAAVVNTAGDMAEKLMAAMEAARSMGGDGRCSCSQTQPTSCGSPPPTFTKSSHIGFMVVARIGDVDGTCQINQSCANGQYYMDLNVANQDGQLADPDPVFQLKNQFDAWRLSWVGRPDHLLSEASVDAPLLNADGASTTTLHVKLVDWQGVAVNHGGATVTVAKEPGSAGAFAAGATVDHGDGTYSIPLTSTGVAGVDTLRVAAHDGVGKVTLHPPIAVGAVKSPALAALPAALSTTQGDDVAFTLDAGPALANRPYVVLCSLSGSSPGFNVDGVHVPLNVDAALAWSYALSGHAPFVQGVGVLDAQGKATAGLLLAPLDLHPIIGATMHWSFVTLSPLDYAAAAAAVTVVP